MFVVSKYDKIIIGAGLYGLYSALFTVNFTTKTKGMGLGLMVVKNVVEQANGNIEFHSELGEGTTFLVSFPLIKS